MDTRSRATFHPVTQYEAQHRRTYLCATMAGTSLFAAIKTLLGSKVRGQMRGALWTSRLGGLGVRHRTSPRLIWGSHAYGYEKCYLLEFGM